VIDFAYPEPNGSFLDLSKEFCMTISMYSASVPPMVKMLSNMLVWLEKAQQHAEAKKFDPKIYLDLRLAPDMLPFLRQIQITCDMAKNCVRRLANAEAPVHEDKEVTLAELQERIRQTIAFINTVPAAQIDGSEERAIEVPMRGMEPLKFKGENYMKHFAQPNFYFHASIAYALLRHVGVPLGKGDYLGSE
jgi:uncharacterized protein